MAWEVREWEIMVLVREDFLEEVEGDRVCIFMGERAIGQRRGATVWGLGGFDSEAGLVEMVGLGPTSREGFLTLTCKKLKKGLHLQTLC